MTKDNPNSSVNEDVIAGLKEGIAWARGVKELRVTQIELPDASHFHSSQREA